MAKHRISIVRYLNAVPLAWGILEGAQRESFEPVLSTPAECADQLAEKRVDVGLIPSIEYQRIKGIKIVPGIAVASVHRVQTVILVSLLPLWKVRTVAFDQGSRTSVALARIVFDEFYHTRPDFRPQQPDVAKMLAGNDAALLVGDEGLRFQAQHRLPDAAAQKPILRQGHEPLQVFDLVERWRLLTGLPFVFAFWAVRDGFRDGSVTDALEESRDFGLSQLAGITEKYAAALELDRECVREYLERNVYYFMDSACVEGLALFYEKAGRIGAIKSSRRIEFL